MTCNCRKCQPKLTIVNEPDAVTVGILYPIVGAASLVEIETEPVEPVETPKNRARARVRGGLRALTKLSKNVAKLAFQNKIPTETAIRAVREINRTRADVQTLSDLDAAPNSDAEIIGYSNEITKKLNRNYEF